jgi:hypothetical protein
MAGTKTTAGTAMGHSQQSTKRCSGRDDSVGDGDGGRNSDSNGNGNGDSEDKDGDADDRVFRLAHITTEDCFQRGLYDFLVSVECPRKPNLLIVDLSICWFFEESTDRQI